MSYCHTDLSVSYLLLCSFFLFSAVSLYCFCCSWSGFDVYIVNVKMFTVPHVARLRDVDKIVFGLNNVLAVRPSSGFG